MKVSLMLASPPSSPLGCCWCWLLCQALCWDAIHWIRQLSWMVRVWRLSTQQRFASSPGSIPVSIVGWLVEFCLAPWLWLQHFFWHVSLPPLPRFFSLRFSQLLYDFRLSICMLNLLEFVPALCTFTWSLCAFCAHAHSKVLLQHCLRTPTHNLIWVFS